MRIIKNHIKRWMFKRNITDVATLAVKANLSDKTVRNLIDNKHEPRLCNAKQLADALGTSIDELFETA